MSMAKEVLVVPEESLPEVIRVIRAGLHAVGDLREETRQVLLEWCEDEEAYLLRGDDRVEP